MDGQIVVEPIYKGATRPPMVFGVPLLAFLMVSGGSFLAGIYLLLLVSAVGTGLVATVAVLALFWMRTMTRRDDQRLWQVFLALRLVLVCRNRAFWRCRSYSPIVLLGGRDGWQR